MEPGVKENRMSGICECGCGAELNGRRGKAQRWASEACRKRGMRMRAHDRRRRRAANHQMIDLGSMTIAERRAALVAAAHRIGL